jgi:multidrug transporter EmrE-like cation transporter
MFKLFLNTTDKFLCNSVKSVFTNAESKFKAQYSQNTLLKELEKFQENPLGCTIGIHSKFEKNIKVKIKFILGIFFVFTPLVIFSAFTYLTHIDISYALFATFGVAILVSSRMEEIANRYVNFRKLELQHQAS